MYLIAKQRGRYQVIPIRTSDIWELNTLCAGQEIRIIVRTNGQHHLLYSTRELCKIHPTLGRAQLVALCDEIIEIVSRCLMRHQMYIDFVHIARVAECHHQRRWRDAGLIPPVPLEQYHGHPIDSKTEQLVSYVRVDLEAIVVMDCEPPVDDCEHEELPY